MANGILSSGNVATSVEVIDLSTILTNSTSAPTCQPLPDTPIALSGASAMTPNSTPLICGGTTGSGPGTTCPGQYLKSCLSLTNNNGNISWSFGPGMINYRAFAATVFFSNQNKTQPMIVSGGVNATMTGMSSLEVLDTTVWYAGYPNLIANAYDSCMVWLPQERLVVIGGITTFGNPAPQTFIHDKALNIWTTGPSLQQARYVFYCGIIKRSSTSSDYSIIVTGGFNGGGIASTEIIDHDSTGMQAPWRTGTALPVAMWGGYHGCRSVRRRCSCWRNYT